MAYSSSKKVQHFETPINLDRSLGRFSKKSEAKYIVEEVKVGDDEKAEHITSDAKRKLIRNSMSIANASNDGLKKLSSIKRFIDNGEPGILSMSSKSIVGLDKRSSLHSSIELLKNA